MMWDSVVRCLVGLAMIGLGIALGGFVRGMRSERWSNYGWGALCFVSSQMAHIPFNAFILNPLFAAAGWNENVLEIRGGPLLVISTLLGLSAGIFEESARWLFYRYKFPNKKLDLALMFGAGHGGCEAIIVGVVAIATLIGMRVLRAHPEQMNDLPDDQKEALQKTLEEYWATPTLAVLMAPLERIFAMTFHLSASVLVYHGFVAESWQFWGAAVAFHAFLDASYLFIFVSYGIYAAEACLALTAFPLSLYILWYYRQIEASGNPYEAVADEEKLQPPHNNETVPHQMTDEDGVSSTNLSV